jgi:hypothetical protein
MTQSNGAIRHKQPNGALDVPIRRLCTWPASCWPVLDHLVESWVALVSAVIICGRLIRRAWTQDAGRIAQVDAHDADWRSLYPDSSGRWVRHQATRPVCRPPNEATWAGSPAASCRPGRGRTRLRPGRAARQHQRGRGRAGHDLAVAAQSLPTTWPRHARPQPPSRPPAAIATARQCTGQPARPSASWPSSCGAGARPGCWAPGFVGDRR